ncbi:MAG TPA: orotidine-5'-phosphate decarboxylase [Acetobacteraceae bacterium]|nr:orotidine-5'-phosphate decarboxylase [Acetobacteraceae bacterium]
MPDGFSYQTMDRPRSLPSDMAQRLIVALDVPSIHEAEKLVGKLDGTVSFFKIGLWLAFAEGVDSLIKQLIESGKKVFLDAKMFDIGQTVEEGVARAADRGVSFVTVHGDGRIIESAVRGKRRRDIKIFSITVLTSLSDSDLREMGYGVTAKELVHLRVRQAIRFGCDGIIASADDNPDEIRSMAGNDKLLIATPGIRDSDEPADDHQRRASARDAINRGADYLVVGRPIIKNPDPTDRAKHIIKEMWEGEKARKEALSAP